MSDLLSIAASGLRAYQTALTTTSENIANAGTTGYVRRTATVREIAAVSTMNNGTLNGMGVTVSGVSRAGDELRSAAVRSAGADLAKTETGATWLQRIEDSMTGNKLGDRITAFFNSAKAVAADPSSLAPRAAMLEAAASVAAAFAATGTSLRAASTDLDATATTAVAQLNTLSAALAKVNNGLGRVSPGTSNAAALLDQRDQLLEQMSALTDVSVSYDALGRVGVKGGNDNGPVLVEGKASYPVSYARNDQGAVSFAVHGAETLALSPAGGALAGIGEGAQRIADAIAQVDGIAKNFAEGVNAVQAGGADLDGNAGAPLFAIGDPASQLSVALPDARGIAAAAAGGGTRDNSNLTALEALRGTGKFETGITDFTAANANALSSRQAVAEAQTAIRDAAVASRDAVSGVNIDEEAVDLMRFQQAYMASSRVIQTARDTLQAILEIR
ncbi:flagellar hook-associated protein FlgK [Sphingomonas sp. MMS12-HWE2-04]|uniref:flagellar hook-associated protein FlgK n=1 Tax=Sphingomonas sp. MMS12-HWE2-04 TaxID=3234199 RepID=UPI00384EA2A2